MPRIQIFDKEKYERYGQFGIGVKPSVDEAFANAERNLERDHGVNWRRSKMEGE